MLQTQKQGMAYPSHVRRPTGTDARLLRTGRFTSQKLMKNMNPPIIPAREKKPSARYVDKGSEGMTTTKNAPAVSDMIPHIMSMRLPSEFSITI